MSAAAETTRDRRRASGPPATGVLSCPACGGPVKPGESACRTCDFRASPTLFPGTPAPLRPILDAADLFTESSLAAIATARSAVERKFPQFVWRICTVVLPAGTNLSMFGFWMLNASPLAAGESKTDRAWTVLLLLDARTGQAAVVPGYAAEPYVSDSEWKSILANMIGPWTRGDPAAAVAAFFQATRAHLLNAWKRFGSRRP